MFGMDMALGADMMGMGAMDMGMGAMDMEIGAMDMAMGNPILGADMMAMGAMDMGIGAMDMGMGMMGGGMMGGGMMGMGAMDMGLGLGMMQVGMMGGGIGICPPGCMRSCCRQVVVCPPGCTGPCCINNRVIVRNVPNNQYSQYNSNSGFVRLPPVPQAQYQQRPQQMQQTQYAKTPGNLDIQQQIINQQNRIEKEKRQQIFYKQRLEQEQLQLQKEKLQFEQKQLEQKRLQQMRMQQLQQRQRLEKMKLEQEEITAQNQLQVDRQLQFKEQFAVDQQIQQNQQAQNNPYEESDEVLMEGCIYQQQFDKWQEINARLTVRTFLGFNVESIHKIKVKYASHVPNTRIIKISVNGRGDVFIAVPTQDQAQWMCRIIWARLNRIGRTCNPNENYVGCYQGEIIRKSFFNGWQVKFASISASGLRLSNSNGGSVTHTITAVPQIWTRFDFVHGNMLIVKMHANGRKNEIGIPVENAMIWLRGLYTLVRPN